MFDEKAVMQQLMLVVNECV